MRRAARVDANQGAIVEALRSVGATVHCTHTVGMGFPDLVCGYRGKNYLLEVKVPGNYRAEDKLTDDERVWHECWRGKVTVASTVREALEQIGAIKSNDL